MSAGSKRDRLILEGVNELNYVVSSFLTNLPTFIEKDDLISEGFVAIVKGADKFDPSLTRENGGAQFKTYIHRRLQGAVINYLGRFENAKRRYNEVDIDYYANNGGAEVFSDDCRAENISDAKIQVSRLFRVLGKEERILAELSFIRELTLREIAAGVDMEPSTVHRQLKRILEKLKVKGLGSAGSAGITGRQ